MQIQYKYNTNKTAVPDATGRILIGRAGVRVHTENAAQLGKIHSGILAITKLRSFRSFLGGYLNEVNKEGVRVASSCGPPISNSEARNSRTVTVQQVRVASVACSFSKARGQVPVSLYVFSSCLVFICCCFFSVQTH